MALFDDPNVQFDDATFGFDSEVEAEAPPYYQTGLRIWVRDGRVVTDEQGKVILCEDCPCPEDTGTATATGTGTSTATSTSTGTVDPCCPTKRIPEQLALTFTDGCIGGPAVGTVWVLDIDQATGYTPGVIATWVANKGDQPDMPCNFYFIVQYLCDGGDTVHLFVSTNNSYPPVGLSGFNHIGTTFNCNDPIDYTFTTTFQPGSCCNGISQVIGFNIKEL